MSSFLRSLKYLRYIGNVHKHIRIYNGHTNVRSSLHVSNDVTLLRRSENAPENPQDASGILHIDNIVKQMDRRFETTGIVHRSFIEQIIEHIEETAGQIETTQALLTLRCSNLLQECTSQERIKLANTLWKLLNMYHVPIDVSHYNALLQVYIENGHEFSPLEILSDMKKKRISPNNATYKCILEYYCNKGNMSDSAAVLECMKEENHPINESIFNLLILGYSQAGDLTSAINILDIMKKMNINPSEKTYTAIMCAYAKRNDIKSINTVLSYCKKKDIHFSNKHILDIIYMLIVNNNMKHVNEMFTKLKKPDYITEIYFLSKVMDIKQDIAMNLFFPILSKNRHRVDYDHLVYFFMNKLMHNNVCPEEIIKVCIHLETKYNDKSTFSKTIYFSFQHDNDLITLNLLKAWKDRGRKLAPHYFWPILAKLVKKNDIRGVLHIVKDMMVIYNVTPCVDTLTDFVIPHLFYDILNIRNELHKLGIPPKIIDNAIVYEFLRNNKTRRASSFVTLNPNVYQESILKDILQQALYNTHDISSFFIILRNMYKETESGEEQKVSINAAILDIMSFISSHTNCIPQIIKYLYSNQLQISTDVHKALSLHLKNNTSSNILQQLTNITEDSLKKQEKLKMPQKNISRKANTNKSAVTNILTSNVMSSYKNLMTLKERKVVIPSYIYVRVVDHLLEKKLIDKSKVVIKHLVIDYPIILTVMFVLKRTQKLLALGYFEDTAEIIENTAKVIKLQNKDSLNGFIYNLLHNIAKTGNEKGVIYFFNVLLKAEYLQPSEILLRPLIMVHIYQDNAVKALEIAELLCEKYQYIPALANLTKLIVLTRDTNLLQRFIDVTTKVYELYYILGELLLCFAENDCENEARKIIKFLATSNYKFTSIKVTVSRYVNKKSTKVLEKLLDYSEGYPEMNRFFIYECLLNIYDSSNDHQSGLRLWERIIKEGITPSSEFIENITNLLNRNNIDTSLIPRMIESV